MSPRCTVVLAGLVAYLAAGCSESKPGPTAAEIWHEAPPYAKSVDPKTTVSTVVTSGQILSSYRLPGIPDGMGLMRRDGQAVLFVNHEFPRGVGVHAGPLVHGARISELLFDIRDGNLVPVRGELAIREVWAGEPPYQLNGQVSISKLCSAFLATESVGFDKAIFLTGEESTGMDTMDGRGGSAFALVDGRMCTLPKIGRASWENIIILPGTGSKTVAICLEDAAAYGDGLNSELYMYVGEKKPGAAEAIERNGLRGGKFYVFVAGDPAMGSEATFRERGMDLPGRWVALDASVKDGELEKAAHDANAFTFIRIEDGAADPTRPGDFYFATTGRAKSVNLMGRLYRCRVNPDDPAAGATLSILLDGSEGVICPDNIDVNREGEIAICEDPNYDLARELKLTRDTSIWILDRDSGALRRVAEVDRAAPTAHARRADPSLQVAANQDYPGGWEFSGIVDASEILGKGSWLCNVQAHSLLTSNQEILQCGQVLVLRTTK